MDTTTPIEMDERPSVPRRRRRILGLTEENRGEANVFMAAFQEFMGMDPDVDIHMASFGNLAEPVAAIQDRARQAGRPHARPVAFHRISGMPMKDALIDHFSRHGVPTTAPDGVPVAMMTPLGFSATRRAIATTVPVFVPYEEPELSVVVESIISIIKDVDPDLVVVGSLLTPGITACYHVNVKFVCLSPNSIKEFAASVQPNAAVLWKYPA